MADNEQYEQKIKDMQKYIPFLESLIKKMKSNRDEKRESHLHKVEMLYGLLTNKDKKLKLETLQKCESVLVKLCEKMEKHDTPTPSTSSQPSSSANLEDDNDAPCIDEMAAPASPSNPEPIGEFHNPIVIPTERRRTPPPPTRQSHPNRTSYEDNNLFDRSRNRYNDHRSGGYNNDHRTDSGGNHSASGSKQSPELFRRRSPNRDRPNRYDEELRKKYEAPPLNASDSSHQKVSTYSSTQDYPSLPRPRVNTVRTKFTSAVLRSPPLTLDDLKDLMNDPVSPNSIPFHPPLPLAPAPVPPPLPVPPPAVIPVPVPAPVVTPLASARQDTCSDKSKDVSNQARQDPRALSHTISGVTEKLNVSRIDPRSVGRIDPRKARDVKTAAPHPTIEAPKQDLKEPKTAEPPVRLAFKYNPHRRRESSTKTNDYEQTAKVDDHRGINHLPSVNPSDPRLRNRPMFTLDTSCPSSSMAHINSPVGNLPSPMSPMANFIDPKMNHAMPDNRNSPIYPGASPFFGKFPPHMTQPMMHTPNMFMTPPANRFKPPPQPRTYGEYRKFKQSIEPKHNKMTVVDPKKDATFYGQNHSPLEVTVKPMEFSKEATPSVLDAMYRNTDFKKDPNSSVQSFKIPKLKKDPPVVPVKDNGAKDWDDAGSNKESNWDEVSSNNELNWDDASNQKDSSIKATPSSTAPKDDTENWDDDEDDNKSSNLKSSQPKSVSSNEDWDTENVDKTMESRSKDPSSVQKPEKKKTEKKQIRDSIDSISDNEDWGDDNYYESCSSDDYFAAKEESATKSKKTNNKGVKANGKKTAKKAGTKPTNKKVSNAKSVVVAAETKAPDETKVPTTKVDVSNPKKEAESSCEQLIGVEPISEDEEDMAMKSKDQRKRKSAAPLDSKPPAKIAKADVASEDESMAGNSETGKDTEMSPLELSKIPDEMPKKGNVEGVADSAEGEENEELPDTIINSDISMNNIIEGKRRTRGSNRFHPAFQSPTSPTKAKSPGMTPPKKKQKTSANSPEDEEAQECAVSSTTTIAEPAVDAVKTSPVVKGRKAVATKKTLENQESVTVEQKPKESVNVEASSSAGSSGNDKDEITKEWLESFLLNLFNPSQMSNNSVLAMLEKVLDANKFQKVKQILCSESELPEGGTEVAAATGTKANNEPAAPDAVVDLPKPKTKKKKNELDRLNDDIREMFICQGVLTATGRRMCTVISEKESELEAPIQKLGIATPSTSAAAKASSKATTAKAAAASKAAPKKKGRRAGVFWKGNKKRKRGRGRPRKAQVEEDEEAQYEEEDLNDAGIDENAESGDWSLPQQADQINKTIDDGSEEELLKIVVGKTTIKKISQDSIEILDSSSDDVDETKLKKEEDSKTEAKTPVSGVLIIDKKDVDVPTKTEEAPVLKAEGKLDNVEIDKGTIEKREIPKLMPVVMLRRRGRPPKSKVGPEFKNINPEMHTQSEHMSNCALCPFVGRHLASHYVRMHKQSEVLISRLPPQNQTRLLQNIGVAAVGRIKKSPNKILFASTCPFCDIHNTFTRVSWVDHYGTHTGEYTFKCCECGRRMNFKSEISKHIRTKCPNGQAIRLRSMLGHGKRVFAYICQLCNYIQMNRQHIVEHLLTQHDIADETQIKEVTLLDCTKVLDIDPATLVASENGASKAKRPRIMGTNGDAADNGKEVTDVERNREIFVSNEQNDVNLDTNIMQFMRDVSFSATGSPPRLNSMSVADRINERLKNVSYQGISDQFESEPPQLTPHKPQSMADRLSERFSRTPPENALGPDVEKPSVSPKRKANLMERFDKISANAKDRKQSSANEHTQEHLAEKNMECEQDVLDKSRMAKVIPNSIKIEARLSPIPGDTVAAPPAVGAKNDASENKDDNDVILISDGEEDTKVVIDNKSKIPPKDKSAPGPSDITEILDDDDDWEDIETPPSPSCLVTEQKGPTTDNKGRKNKTILATLNRLYASIVQPKTKSKLEATGKDTGRGSDNNVDRKKCEANGMQRINNIGFSRKSAEALKYHCLVDGCSFLYSDIPDGLQNHVIFEHPALTWNGFCHICDAQINDGQSLKLADELNHMQEVHINCSNGHETVAQTQSGAIKIRRLSGDVLSGDGLSGQIQVYRMPPSPPPLQITSAVSLNKNSDIWKPVSPGEQQKGSLPIVIKSISATGSPTVLINPSTKSPSPTQSSLKIAKITSIAGTSVSPIKTGIATSTTTTVNDLHPSLKIVNVESQSTTNKLLKPWTHSVSMKSDMIAKSMLRETSLYALFKCMANECDFVADSKDYFAKHLVNHAKPPNNEKQEAWQSCCYCNVWATNITKLIEHIATIHEKDIFQCAYCFYRSCEECNVETHQNSYHVGHSTKILVCSGEKPQTWDEFHKLRDRSSYNIDAINCADCMQTFISPTEFARHINEHPHMKNSTVYRCGYCISRNNSINKSDALQHLLTAHGIGDNYQCVYCNFASDEVKELELHMANSHPSNLLFCCHRPTQPDAPIKETIFATSDTGVTILSLWKYVDASCLKHCPFTDDELKNPNFFKFSTDMQTASAATTSDIAKSMMAENTVCRSTKILNAAVDIVKHTGNHIDLLYKCGVESCGQLFQHAKSFRVHMAMHSPQNLPCYHCGELFASAVTYTNHYTQHERHRYFCFLCFETDRTAASLALHIAKHHAIKGKSTIVTYALIKGSVNAKRDFFFVCPNSVKAVDVVRFGDRLLKMWERKKWSQMKKAFTPDEMEQLPRQAIFFEELYCATCQYKTKVRTNLYRHLQFHKNEVNVASVDPVNPVPCLNSSERHFDKMTNLACSSHANKPSSSGANGPSTSGGSPFPTSGDKEGTAAGTLRRVEHVLPEFIPINKRYVCKTADCQFATTSEIMFKQHLNSGHSSEKNYSCPHCNVVVCASKICADKVAHHMRFHDTNLYQCKRCGYLHFHKPVLERHLSEKHPNEKTFYFIYNRNEGGVQKTSSEMRHSGGETSSNAAEQFASEFFSPLLKWQCTLCKTRTATQNQMTAHINITHNIKYRYQCSNCNFGGVTVTSIGDHAQRKHANVVTEVVCFYSKVDVTNMEAKSDTTPLWRRDPNKVKNIRGILMDVESIAPLALPIASHSSTNDDDELMEIEEDVDEIHESLIGLTPESRVCHICSYPAPDIASLRAHITEKHEEQNKENLDKLFKYVCFHCTIGYETFAEFRDHWSQIHQPPLKQSDPVKDDHQEGRAAWFTVWRRYRCSKCSHSNDYRELAIHHFLEHSKESFAVRDIEDVLKCGHCSFKQGSDLPQLSEHYKQKHSLATGDTCKSPIPPIPSTPLVMDQVRDLMTTGGSLQFFKCNICHAILHDMNACKMHCAQLHDIQKNVPCTVLQGMIYKCPTCQFCSPVEINVAKHIFNKLKNNSFNNDANVLKPEGVKESIWPFMSLVVIFPNGFVIEKYRLLGTQFGSMQVIENFVKKQEDAGTLVAVEEAASLANVSSDNSARSKDDFNEADRDNKSTNDPAKRRLVTKSAVRAECVDKLESDDTAELNKKSKPSNPECVTAEPNMLASILNSTPSTTNDKNPVAMAPFSFYGNKPEFRDLGSIIANVIVDGVKVMIPAKDIHKVFKKTITLKLQKVNVDEKRPDQHEINRSKTARIDADESICETPKNDDPKN